MDRALVVVSNDDASEDLLREAGELAAGVDAELLLLSTMTEEEFESDAAVLEQIGEVEGTSYGEDTVIDAARENATRLGRETIDDLDVEYEGVGAVAEPDERHRRIVEVAERENCDYVFVVGRKRSPAGKAIFGDVAQRVILEFDGRVVIDTE